MIWNIWNEAVLKDQFAQNEDLATISSPLHASVRAGVVL